MDVFVSILLLTYTIFVNSAARFPRTLYDLSNHTYHLDAQLRLAAPLSGSTKGLLHDEEGRLYTVNHNNIVFRHASQVYTLYDATGRSHFVLSKENKLMRRLRKGEIGLVLVDLKGSHYIIQADANVIPANVPNGPQPPPAHPINNDRIMRNTEVLGRFVGGQIHPDEGISYPYNPEPGDKVVRFRKWSQYQHGKWYYVID